MDESFLAENFLKIFLFNNHRKSSISGHHLFSRRPADGGDLALQLPNARLAGVVGDDSLQSPIGDFKLGSGKTMVSQGLGYQMGFSDMKFFGGRVPREFDDFHAVKQRPG